MVSHQHLLFFFMTTVYPNFSVPPINSPGTLIKFSARKAMCVDFYHFLPRDKNPGDRIPT